MDVNVGFPCKDDHCFQQLVLRNVNHFLLEESDGSFVKGSKEFNVLCTNHIEWCNDQEIFFFWEADVVFRISTQRY